MVDMAEFRETKNALLRYYTSNLTSQGARLIGVAIAAFTLIQTVQHSKEEPLSRIFSYASAVLYRFAQILKLSELIPSFVATLKLVLFGGILFALLFFIVRSIFRFVMFGYYSSYLIRVKYSEISESTKPLHYAIHHTVLNNIRGANQKLYGIFPLIWFVARGEARQHWIGLVICGISALFSTSILLWFLW